MKKRALQFASLFSIALLLVLFAASRAAAQDGDGDDPPSRVARLSFTRGAVSFQPAGTDDWIDATVNRPLTTGDKLWSDSGSRAALHIGSASIHLSQNTGFSFLNLTDNVAQIQLTAGTIRIRVKRLGDDDDFEVDTPNLAFNILSPGIYKISVNESGDATIIEDRKGQGQVTGGGSEYDVYEGDVGTFSGSDEISEDIGDLDAPDDFEQWSEQRDHHEDVSVSAQYVSDDAIGYDDLDDNGGWRPVAEYGTIWFPHTAMVGWAPYHYGHWAYVAPWGYSWVDDASWGFAPFHYGRWVSVDGAWGWIPCPPRPAVAVYGGPVYVRPMYAPALVAWVGGPGFSMGIGVGGGGFAAGVNVAWFPLGPREVFVPSYPVSRNYVTNVNVSNTRVDTVVVNNYYNTVVVNKTVNVTNITYVNQRVPGAVVATSPTAFTGGGSVSKNFVQVDARVVASAPVAAMTPPAVPQRSAVLGGRASVTVRPPAAIQARAVVAKTAPPPPPPSFAQRQQAIQSNGGRPISIAASRKITPVRTASAAPAVKVAPPAKPAAPKNAPPGKTNRPPIQSNNGRPVNSQQNANRPANAPPAVNNNRPANPPPAAGNANRAANPPPQPANKAPDNKAPENANRPATPPPANNNRPPQAAPNNNNRPGAARPEEEKAPQENAKPQPKPEAKPEVKPQPKPEPKPEEKKPAAKPQPPAKENKPEGKPKDNEKEKAKPKDKDDKPPKNDR
ncbi:MAG: DUF6600 domain-containing protein [Candidatus Acidiferrum sp.]|jgi:hypothetical protein